VLGLFLRDRHLSLPSVTRIPRAVRLANALRMRDRKKLVDPTDEDIQDMRAKIGDNLSFARLADANKSDLFCAMLTIRRKLQIYDDLIKSEEEELGPLLSALASLVAAIPNLPRPPHEGRS
jgi:hypothetical protein